MTDEIEAEVIEDGLAVKSFAIDIDEVKRHVLDMTAALDKAARAVADLDVGDAALEAMSYRDVKRFEQGISGEIREADAARLKFSKEWKKPLAEAEARFRAELEPARELHARYRARRVELDERDREERRDRLRAYYEDMAPMIALPLDGQNRALVPFERILDEKWLNRSAKEPAAEAEIDARCASIAEGERSLDGLGLAHAAEAKAAYWETLDLQAAIARDRELTAAEERARALEAERAAQAEQERSRETEHEAERAAESETHGPANGQAPQKAEAAAPKRKGAPGPCVMVIDSATTDQMREIGRFCGSLVPPVTGRFVRGTVMEAANAERARLAREAAERRGEA